MNNHQQVHTSAQTDHLGRLLIELSRDFQRRTLEHCRQRGHARIRNSHASVVLTLGRERQRLTDLAERGGMTQQAMGKLVKELERIGYVVRHTDPEDRRAKIIELTERGRQLLADNGQIMAQLQREYAELLGSQHLQVLEQELRYAREQLGTCTAQVGNRLSSAP